MESYPTLLRVESEVIVCAQCHRWVIRVPQFTGFDDDWQCEYCGCTSTVSHIGRSFGPKSREWDRIVSDFEWTWNWSKDFSSAERADVLIGCIYEEQK